MKHMPPIAKHITPPIINGAIMEMPFPIEPNELDRIEPTELDGIEPNELDGIEPNESNIPIIIQQMTKKC
jgi:hypothetical protein